ncbi:hypothetical protein J4413_01635 [Candidatus Woesearchaeota archaeon]|nr:hypothetical protein [Candidatus Woesearchaeota archaeon]
MANNLYSKRPKLTKDNLKNENFRIEPDLIESITEILREDKDTKSKFIRDAMKVEFIKRLTNKLIIELINDPNIDKILAEKMDNLKIVSKLDSLRIK